ncbi:MAG: hypothetical protein ACK5WX_09870, partial [bacterium]
MTQRVQTVLSGLALATSWTWCIGMFAPIVIGQMFGWPGILAFAVPNILGCALFGYVRSRAILIFSAIVVGLCAALFA